VTAPDELSTARALATDLVAAEVATALAGHDIHPLLLKGRTLARLLYDDGAARPYVDVDLLVSPAEQARVESLLGDLGFVQQLGDGDVASGIALHAHPWGRARDQARLDLHRTLRGLGAPPERVWQGLSGSARRESVGGTQVRVPDRPSCALHVAIHAADRGAQRGKPIEDLRRALERFSHDEWRAAAEMAEELDGLDAFAAGLRSLPQGERLADRLGLRAGRSVHVALAASGAPELAHGLEHLSTMPGLRPRLRAMARVVFPTPSSLRTTSVIARRGAGGLALAYLQRPFWLAARTPGTMLAWRRARRETK
jgi:hypothetical protein